MENEAMQVINIEEYAMTPDVIRRQVNLIQEVMKEVMKEGEHFGTIPGTKKPTLLKPGAEKLAVTFRLAPTYKITKTEMPGGHREYEVVCTLTHINSGLVIGEGVGSCSTMETKYRFRKAEQKCPTCGELTIIKGKKEYGGGWLCFKKMGGCGAKFKDGDPEIENQEMGRIEHDNPADYYNTVLKMGKKRSHVDATLTATAASDIFTQDVEDMPSEAIQSNDKPKTKNEPKDDRPSAMKKKLRAMVNKEVGKDEAEQLYEWLYAQFKDPKKTKKNTETLFDRWDKAIEKYQKEMKSVSEDPVPKPDQEEDGGPPPEMPLAEFEKLVMRAMPQLPGATLKKIAGSSLHTEIIDRTQAGEREFIAQELEKEILKRNKMNE